MAMVKKSITVTDKQALWIKAQMETGNYATDSELIREALREKQQRMAQIEAIREKIIEGEQSGDAGLLDIESIKRQAREAVKPVE